MLIYVKLSVYLTPKIHLKYKFQSVVLTEPYRKQKSPNHLALFKEDWDGVVYDGNGNVIGRVVDGKQE